MEGSDDLQRRMDAIRVASSQIHNAPADEPAVASYLDLATEACKWSATSSSTRGTGSSASSGQTVENVQKDIVLFCTRVAAVAAQCANLRDSFASIKAFLTMSLSLVRITSERKELSEGPDRTFAHLNADLVDNVATLLVKIRDSLDFALVSRNLTSSKNQHVNAEVDLLFDILTSTCGNLVHVANMSAASGSLEVLNASWKAVICLLQPKEGCRVTWETLDICKIVSVLVDQAIQKLRIVLELSIVCPESTTTPPNTKGVRTIKFFVTFAGRIARWYPKQCGGAHGIISQFATKLFATLSVPPDFLHNTDLKKALCETVWPVTSVLLHTVLCSDVVEKEQKSQFLMGIVNGYSSSDEDSCGKCAISIIEQVFPANETTMFGVLGKVGCTAFYLNLLLISSSFKGDVLLEFCKHLDWLVDTVAEEEVYSRMVEFQTFPKHAKEGAYTSNMQTMFVWALQALGTFAIVAASSGLLHQVELFLFRNAVHPCGLCAELIKDVWCFLIRHGEHSLVTEHISAVFSTLQAMCSSKNGKDCEIPLQRMARLLCSLIGAAPETEAFRIFQLAYNQETFLSTSAARIAHLLLEEGLSFALLPEHRRRAATLQLTSACLSALNEFSEQMELGNVSVPSECHHRAAASLLAVFRISTETGEELESVRKKEAAQVCLKIVTFSLRNRENEGGAQTAVVLTRILGMFQYVRDALTDDDMKDLLILLEARICGGASQDVGMKLTLLPALAQFLALLSDISFQEDGHDPSTKALWNLYHVVLKAEHWALFHAGLSSFATFASNTCLGELWRFVPPVDTASTESESQQTTAEENLMNALQVFLEKQQGRPYLETDTDERETLRMECKRQKTARTVRSYVPDGTVSNTQQCHEQPERGAVSLPPDLSRALALLQEGAELLKDKLPEWLLNQPARDSEQYHRLASQLARIRGQVCIP